MSETGRKLWERVIEPSEGKVHFVGEATLGNATLCGITDWLTDTNPGTGLPTTQPVNCNGCLGIVRYVLNRGLPKELRS